MFNVLDRRDRSAGLRCPGDHPARKRLSRGVSGWVVSSGKEAAGRTQLMGTGHRALCHGGPGNVNRAQEGFRQGDFSQERGTEIK